MHQLKMCCMRGIRRAVGAPLNVLGIDVITRHGVMHRSTAVCDMSSSAAAPMRHAVPPRRTHAHRFMLCAVVAQQWQKTFCSVTSVCMPVQESYQPVCVPTLQHMIVLHGHD
jgi:hypothetical protein